MPRRQETKPAPLDLYVQHGVESRWQEEAAKGDRVIMFSPFVTGPLAKRVLAPRAGVELELYTTFSARYFASGASCLDTLEHLLGHVKLFEIDRLHAKLMLIPGKIATVGSQNLTQGGTGNLEASVLTSDPDFVARVEAEVEPWVRRSREITHERIAEMRSRVGELKKLWSQFNEASKRSDEEERKKRTIRAIRRLPKETSEVVIGEIKRDHKPPRSYRLFFKANKTFQNLRVSGDGFRPKRKERYLCINEDNGKLGWVRLGETEVTLVSREIPWNYEVDIEDETTPTFISAVWDAEELRTHNLEIGLRWKRGRCQVQCLFAVESLTAVGCTWEPGTAGGQPDFDIVGYINSNEKSIREELISIVTGTTDYPGNVKLTGAYANEFFGPTGTQCSIRVIHVGRTPVLIAKVNGVRT